MVKQVILLAAIGNIVYFFLVMAGLAVFSHIGYREVQVNTQIKVTPSKPVVRPGESFEILVDVVPAEAIAGAQFNLRYNPGALKVQEVAEGNLFKQGGAMTYFVPGSIDNVNGLVKAVLCITLGAGQVVDAPGTFARLSCTAVTAGKTSGLVLEGVIVGNKEGVAVPLESPTINQVIVASSSDLNLDGLVNRADAEILVAIFGTSGPPGWRREDINADGMINVLDLVLVGQHWS